MEYIMAKISFMGNDDYNYEGWKVARVVSQSDWESQIKDKIQDCIDNYDGTVYHSDNDGTPFESVEELFDTVTLTKITEAEYNTVLKLFGGSSDHTNFLEYTAPAKKKKPK